MVPTRELLSPNSVSILVSDLIENAVKRATEHAAQTVRVDMMQGLSSLASIAFSAPLVGVLGTVLAIFGCFLGTVGDRFSIYLALMGRLADALIPMETGLLVAVIAFCGHSYFQARMDEFEIEMKIASLQLISQLALTSV